MNCCWSHPWWSHLVLVGSVPSSSTVDDAVIESARSTCCDWEGAAQLHPLCPRSIKQCSG